MAARWLPTVAGYLLGEFGRSVALCLGGFIALYLCIDFFERFRGFLGHGASAGLVLAYFLLKTPRIVTEIVPVAVLAGTLLGLGNLAKRNELMAMRACGISLWQMAAPVLLAGLGISVAALAWNEYVVPPSLLRAHYIEHVKIKKKQLRGHFAETAIWYHGKESFTNVDRFDARRSQVHGLTRYEFDGSFRLARIVVVRLATWTGSEWEASDASEVLIAPDGALETRPLGSRAAGITETPEDLGAVLRDPNDLSFAALLDEIRDLHRKGIDTTDATVDLWLKLAVPFVSLVMALVAVPLAVRPSRGSSVAANVGAALVVGFSYWVVLALTTSLGRSGVLPPLLAAWSANAIFAAIGVIFFLGTD